MANAPVFPFSAVVGADEVKLAFTLVAIDPAVGGVLLRGQKGSAKSTLARAMARLIPGDAPFVELPVGTSEDRLIGTVDLAAALTGGEFRFHPGLLAQAHRGLLYVDEVNLLPDHLVDVLLDVAASGVNRVEREGISHAHPARIVLVGSMNPEEGELRPQFLDRFGLAVDVMTPTDPDLRAEAVNRRLAFDADPLAFLTAWEPAEQALAARLAAARPAALETTTVRAISALCASVGAEGLRADLVICRAAAALAGWEGRGQVATDDVRRVAPLALGHRGRRSPFDDHGIDREALNAAMDDALDRHPDPAQARPGPPPTPPTAPTPPASTQPSPPSPPTPLDPAAPASPAPVPASQDGPAGRDPERAGDNGAAGQSAGENGPPGRDDASSGGERMATPGMAGSPLRLESQRNAKTALGQPASGRRSVAEGPRGRLVGDRAPGPGGPSSVALAASIHAAAARRTQAAARSDGGERSPGRSRATSPFVEAGDIREAVRVQRTGNLVVLVVDASGSMGSDRRMEAAKGAVLALLVDAYQRRDRVALVTFRGDEAAVALRPTASVEVAKARLADLATGGRTPLAAGIMTALRLAEHPGATTGHRPLMVVVTDGRATSGPADTDPLAAAVSAASAVRSKGVGAVVVDAEDGNTRLGLARVVADAMGARYLTVPELTSGAVVDAVRALQAAAPPPSGTGST